MNNGTSTQKRLEEKQLIEHMLSEIESHLEQKGRTNEFIESIREQFDARGGLSDKQIDAVLSFYDKI